MTWIVVHRSSGPNLIVGPFEETLEAARFAPATDEGELEYDCTSFHDTLEEALVERAKEETGLCLTARLVRMEALPVK